MSPITNNGYDFYFALGGFLFSLVFSFYLFKRFRACFASDARPAPTEDDEIESIRNEIDHFKIRVKEMKTLVSKKRALHEDQISQIISNINNLVERLESMDPSFVDEIHPSLISLIKDLEHIRRPPAP